MGHAHFGDAQKISAANLHRNCVVIPHVTTHDEADITDPEQFLRPSSCRKGPGGVHATSVYRFFIGPISVSG